MTFEEFAQTRLPALAFAIVLTGQRATAEDGVRRASVPPLAERALFGRAGVVMACAARGCGLATGWSSRRR
jgi:hypothetical protein